MNNVYYLETRPGCVQKVIDFLKSKGLITDILVTHYIKYQRGMHGELLMWLEGDKNIHFVHLADEDVVRRIGTKVEY